MPSASVNWMKEPKQLCHDRDVLLCTLTVDLLPDDTEKMTAQQESQKTTLMRHATDSM